MTRTILTCAGIGDSVWLIQKLVNASERFHFRLACDEPRRGHPIFELIPQLAESVCYDENFTSVPAIQTNIQISRKRWAEITEGSFFLTVNEHLERGHRLEAFLPDLATSFRIGWATERHFAEAEELMPPGVYVGLYGSSYSTMRSWGFWEAKKWAMLADKLVRAVPETVFVLIGASFDLDLAGDLSKLLTERGVRHLTLLGKPLGLVIEAMKRMRHLFAFPSGIGILGPTVGCPTTMFYPPHLRPMMNAWADPLDISTGLYAGLPFVEPEEAFENAMRRSCGLTVLERLA